MRPLIRPLAATALVAAAGMVWAPSPAAASVCGGGSGVTVVVDFKQLGGGVETGCVTDQGTADDLFRAAGHSLENVQGQAFVCRVDGLPTQEQEACVRTPPSNAYWGLFWSDGESGTWTYSTAGPYSLDVPDGGSVAFAWQGSSSRQNPGVPPAQHADEPAQQPERPEEQHSPQPSQPPSSGGGGTPSTPPATSASPSASAGASQQSEPGGQREKRQDARDDRARVRDREREESPTSSPADATAPTTPSATEASDPPDAAEDGLPVWVGPAAVGGLFATLGLAAYLRRRAA